MVVIVLIMLQIGFGTSGFPSKKGPVAPYHACLTAAAQRLSSDELRGTNVALSLVSRCKKEFLLAKQALSKALEEWNIEMPSTVDKKELVDGMLANQGNAAAHYELKMRGLVPEPPVLPGPPRGQVTIPRAPR